MVVVSKLVSLDLSSTASALCLPAIFLITGVYQLVFMERALSSSVESDSPAPLLTETSTICPPAPPVPGVTALIFRDLSVTSLPVGDYILRG